MAEVTNTLGRRKTVVTFNCLIVDDPRQKAKEMFDSYVALLISKSRLIR